MIYCKQLNKGLYILQQSMCITHENCRNCLFNHNNWYHPGDSLCLLKEVMKKLEILKRNEEKTCSTK